MSALHTIVGGRLVLNAVMSAALMSRRECCFACRILPCSCSTYRS